MKETDLDAPEMQSLRDYLEAVSAVLTKNGATPDEVDQIRTSITEQVGDQLPGAKVTQDAVEKVVRSLATPESYTEDVDADRIDINSSPPAKRMLKPWMLFTGAGAILGLILLASVVYGVFVFISYRNKIVISDQVVDAATAQVEVVLQRRFDLIPNLVETVKGYAAHESEVFTEVTRLRSQWQATEDPEERRAFAIKIEPQIGRLMAVAEQYPNLRASQNFLTLQTQLESTENRIAIERRRMNLAIRDYNALIEIFPGNIVAGVLDYDPKELYYKADPQAQAAPKVSF